MSFIQYIRALLVLIIAPPLTFIVSVLAWTDVMLIRKSPARCHVFPRSWGRIICRLAGVKVTIEGAENIEPDSTYIFAGNHVSQFDIFSFQGYFPHDFRWIAKKELFRIPLFGQAMHRAGNIPIDRSRGREAMNSLNEAARQIGAGTSVLIFPEGTRSMDGRLQPFKSGAATLAIKAGVEVVPICFVNTGAILPKGKLLANRGEIFIRVGKPVPVGDYRLKQKQELADLLHERVAELLARDSR